MIALVLLLAGAVPEQASTCAKLQATFESNERTYAVIDRHLRRTGELSPFREIRRVELQQDQRRKDNAEDFKVEGDRITTLLIANHCQPPDHVTSPYTYKK